ncbi:MAG: hypothetical protein RR073_05080, partial [Clostridia bacterium]
MKKRILSMALALTIILTMLSSISIVFGIETWQDVLVADFEDPVSLTGINDVNNEYWAIGGLEDSTSTTYVAGGTTTRQISGTRSLRFYNDGPLDWNLVIRKQFGSSKTRFKSGAEALTFQILTRKNCTVDLSMYDGVKGTNYKTTAVVTGKDTVQTVIVPLSTFVADGKNLVTELGDALYTSAQLTMKMFPVVSGSDSEVIFDNFMQTKLAGYITPPGTEVPWSDVVISNGDMEAETALNGVNDPNELFWANQQEDSNQSIKLSTTRCLSGKRSIVFSSDKALDWRAHLRKQFSPTAGAIKKGAEAITFQYYTTKSGRFDFSLYDAQNEKNYAVSKQITGKPEVQVMIIPLTEFMQGTTNIIAGMGEYLYAPNGGLTFKMETEFAGKSEVIIDNFMQTKLSGYITTPPVNDLSGNKPDPMESLKGKYTLTKIDDFEGYADGAKFYTETGKDDSATKGWILNIENADGGKAPAPTLINDERTIFGEKSVSWGAFPTADYDSWTKQWFKYMNHDDDRIAVDSTGLAFAVRIPESVKETVVPEGQPKKNTFELRLQFFDGTNIWDAIIPLVGSIDVQTILVNFSDFKGRDAAPALTGKLLNSMATCRFNIQCKAINGKSTFNGDDFILDDFYQISKIIKYVVDEPIDASKADYLDIMDTYKTSKQVGSSWNGDDYGGKG